jgi:CheY-like chemotaxis protein
MHQEVTILIAEDDEGHVGLIRKNLARSGIKNQILHFADGQLVLDFLFQQNPNGPNREFSHAYVLLLDIRMPKVSGVEVLEQIKSHPDLKKIPTIMITTTDDPREIEKCHDLGCNSYITKPVEYENFVHAIRNLGLFLAVVQVPEL